MDLLASHAMRDVDVDPAFEMTETERNARAKLAAKAESRAARAAEKKLSKAEATRIGAAKRAGRRAERQRQKEAAAIHDDLSEEENQGPILDLDNLPPLPDLFPQRRFSRSPSESADSEEGDQNRRRSFASFLQSQEHSQYDPPVVSPPRMSDSEDSRRRDDNSMAGGARGNSSEREDDGW